MRLLTLLFFFLGSSAFGQKYILKVNVSGFENSNGKLYFQLETPDKKVVQQRIESITGNKVLVTIPDLPKGKYAVRVFHDENNNKKLDTNLVGFPTEGWGLSNNVKARFGPPKFEDAVFLIEANKEISIQLN